MFHSSFNFTHRYNSRVGTQVALQQCPILSTYKNLRKTGSKSWNDDKSIKIALELVLEVISKYKLNKSIKILELGCGDGKLSLSLAELDYHISGIDISPTAIEWAQEKAVNRDLKIDFMVGNILNMAFDDNLFDLAIDSYCLHCIVGNDRKKFLKEVKRILKPDGVLTGITMSNTIPNDAKPYFNDKREMVKNGVAGRYIGLSDDILKELMDAGFEMLDHLVVKVENEADDLKYVCRKINE